MFATGRHDGAVRLWTTMQPGQTGLSSGKGDWVGDGSYGPNPEIMGGQRSLSTRSRVIEAGNDG